MEVWKCFSADSPVQVIKVSFLSFRCEHATLADHAFIALVPELRSEGDTKLIFIDCAIVSLAR